MAYEINYDDERFQKVETERDQALTENEKLYGGMVDESNKYYQAQIDASKEWATTQQKNQQEQTDFAIEQIEQQKDQAHKDYLKEQSGAYVDWQKESNRYGANAEQMAAQGLANTGYSESSQVSMYNTYQNRVASARESYTRAILNYDNAIKDARLQNNSVLAEIAYNSLQQQLELSLQGFQYKNQLLLEKANQKTQIQTRFDNKYQAVLDQMNKENALQEELRQFNANYSLQQQKLKEEIRQYNTTLAEEKRQFNAQLAEEQRQYNTTLAQKSASSGSSSIKKSSSSGSSKSGSSKSSSSKSSVSKASTSKSSSSSNDKATMQSIINLGYGPISASKLEELVRTGLVEEYTKNGVTLFRRKGPINDFQRLQQYQALKNPLKSSVSGGGTGGGSR